MADSRDGPRGLPPSTDVLHLARTYGITRDQAKRLVKKFRNDLKKLDESARILGARSSRQFKPRSGTRLIAVGELCELLAACFLGLG